MEQKTAYNVLVLIQTINYKQGTSLHLTVRTTVRKISYMLKYDTHTPYLAPDRKKQGKQDILNAYMHGNTIPYLDLQNKFSHVQASLSVSRPLNIPAICQMYQSDRSAQILLHAAMLKYMLRIKLPTSPAYLPTSYLPHSILTPGQPILAQIKPSNLAG